MSNCKPITTPLIPNIHLEPATESEKRLFQALNINYQSAVGSLSYLSTATRPDLSCSIISKRNNKFGLKYQKDLEKPIVAYSDADWGNCKITRRSTTGYLIKINDNLIIWKTCKQPTVSLSSAEAEYKSLTDLTSEILWLRPFCKEIKIDEVKVAIIVHEDNQGCIDTANSDCNTNTQWMKHIYIQLHFIREIIANSIIKLKYTPTTDMLDNFLTKSTTRPDIN
ncbi:hypothetical protein O181_028234 [Austropuccinia psidii MF-1]|uniref:Reverse transcriptase Ty1/copia-type domain-containing protein n=1 Tax=Austropuccinia psidii MF-1 TaxID=1389203 RepID=A0A9Q3CNH3_9BASI|nr:hypothetical protein [Austropuccinia psidii MF-1]